MAKKKEVLKHRSEAEIRDGGSDTVTGGSSSTDTTVDQIPLIVQFAREKKYPLTEEAFTKYEHIVTSLKECAYHIYSKLYTSKAKDLAHKCNIRDTGDEGDTIQNLVMTVLYKAFYTRCHFIDVENLTCFPSSKKLKSAELNKKYLLILNSIREDVKKIDNNPEESKILCHFKDHLSTGSFGGAGSFVGVYSFQKAAVNQEVKITGLSVVLEAISKPTSSEREESESASIFDSLEEGDDVLPPSDLKLVGDEAVDGAGAS